MDSATFASYGPLLDGLSNRSWFKSLRLPVAGGQRVLRQIVPLRYAGRQFNIGANGHEPNTSSARRTMYSRRVSCLVVPPPIGRTPRAIIKLIGGAFIGAIPEVTYRYLIELLTKEGFIVISVPYSVTFDHSQAAYEVHERFNSCLNDVLVSGIPDAFLKSSQLVDLPIFGVGHSNGALLQVLVGSYFSENITKANAIVSFNNRPAKDAVPYFDQVGPMLSQLRPVIETLPLNSMATSTLADMWRMLLDPGKRLINEIDKEALTSFNQFMHQLPSVLNQVTDGVSEFKPTPSQNREFIANSYNVKHTLLVKFNVDSFDDTDLLEETLKSRIDFIGGTLDKIQLSGTHITPCNQELNWQVRNVYTPADAIGQGLKALSLNDIRAFSRSTSDWFRQFEG